MSNKRVLFAAVLFFGLLAMTARSATDPDLWWHLRTGQLIVETGHVPHADPFSFTRLGKPWVSHEWLSEIVLYELWTRVGPGALIVFSSIVTTMGFLILYWRCPATPHWAAALTVLGALAAAPSWGARPQMFTFVFASLLLWLLEQAEHRPRLLLFIPPLFLLWLNLHAGFALGPALMFLYALGMTFECMAGTTPWQQCRLVVGRVLAITLGCMALVPLNPSGTQLYLYPLETLRSSGMRAYIVEWFSPDFHHWIYGPLLLIILLALAALAYSRHRVRGRVLLPLLFTAAAALDAVRHIPIFVLLALPVIASAIPVQSGQSLLSRPRSALAKRKTQPSLYLAAALLAFFAIVRWVDLARDQQAGEADAFPSKAVDFLRTSTNPTGSSRITPGEVMPSGDSVSNTTSLPTAAPTCMATISCARPWRRLPYCARNGRGFSITGMSRRFSSRRTPLSVRPCFSIRIGGQTTVTPKPSFSSAPIPQNSPSISKSPSNRSL